MTPSGLPLQQIVFFVFAAITIFSAVMVIATRNPVRSVLFLVLTFFTSAVLWMSLQAEFLSLVLIFVYVGAVMTLFLFVVMMMNIDVAAMTEGFVRYLPIGLLAAALLIGIMFLVIGPGHLTISSTSPVHYGPQYSNVKQMGMVLYTHYLYPFEIAALILLVAIIAAISLAFHGRRTGTKSQKISQQLKARKQDRLRIIDMGSEGKKS
jgi:NADH-quinone oxidoreductase subunit J